MRLDPSDVKWTSYEIALTYTCLFREYRYNKSGTKTPPPCELTVMLVQAILSSSVEDQWDFTIGAHPHLCEGLAVSKPLMKLFILSPYVEMPLFICDTENGRSGNSLVSVATEAFNFRKNSVNGTARLMSSLAKMLQFHPIEDVRIQRRIVIL